MKSSSKLVMTLVVLGWLVPAQTYSQGVVAPGAGPINRAMSGASTAAAVDLGASYWNPAAIGVLDHNEVLIGTELIIPSIQYSATLPARSIAGVFPPTDRSGSTQTDSGVATNLAVGASYKLDSEIPLSFGILINGIVGGNVNFPGGFGTPTLGPRQPPDFFGVGPVYANLSLLSIKPMVAYQMLEGLTVAVAPVVTTGNAQFNPAFFAPGPPDAFGVPTFPSATNARPFWGGGFEIGLIKEINSAWSVGFSYKSPVWQQTWQFNTYNPDLSPRSIGIQAEIPPIYSWGVAFKGVKNLVVDVDLRYFDYANAALWGDSIQSGGLAWDSIFALALGAQYQVTERLSLLGGYLYNQNPINEVKTIFNLQAPGFLQHSLSLGGTFRLNDSLMFTLGWVHNFENSIQGPLPQIPGTNARLTAQVNSLMGGVTINY